MTAIFLTCLCVYVIERERERASISDGRLKSDAALQQLYPPGSSYDNTIMASPWTGVCACERAYVRVSLSLHLNPVI